MSKILISITDEDDKPYDDDNDDDEGIDEDNDEDQLQPWQWCDESDNEVIMVVSLLNLYW